MSENPTAAPLRQRGVIIAAGLAAAAIIAAAIAIPMLRSAPAEAAQLAQPAAGGPAAACAELTSDGLSGADTAFQAVVQNIDGGTVTLTVSDRFAGDIPDTVTTTQGTTRGVDGEPIEFQSGVTYLIAASEGVIWTCGASGPASAELEDVYAAAFAR